MKRPSLVVLTAFLFVAALIVLSVHFSRGRREARWRVPTGKGKPCVAIGANHGAILASDGSLWTWGEDGFGWHVLGFGTNVSAQALLRRIGSETNWVNVAVGGSTTLALKSDGTIWAWGENVYGQLGKGTSVPDCAVPVHSVPGNDWVQVATGGPHSVALKRDGTLWSWGNNWAGQLGDGTTNNSRVPVQVGSSTNWMRVWANLIENVAQQKDGTLWFWGWDYSRSTKGSSVPVPTRVSPDRNWVDVGLGDWMVFAIKSDGTLWAWGRNAHLYTGASPDADSSPVRVGTDTEWRACATFASSCPLFMKRDRSLWAMDLSDHRGVANVTGIVSGMVTNNQLSVVADSTTLGGDPAFGIFKSLQITYELGSTNETRTFRENAAVRLGEPGQTLTITRALYGDSSLFNRFGATLKQASNASPAQLRRIRLEKDVAAFCGGRHLLGVALTSGGEVWEWGEALGKHTVGVPPLQFCSRLLNRLGLPVRWGEPGPVVFTTPTRLSNTD